MNPFSTELSQRILHHLTDLPDQFGAGPVRLFKKKLNVTKVHRFSMVLMRYRTIRSG